MSPAPEIADVLNRLAADTTAVGTAVDALLEEHDGLRRALLRRTRALWMWSVVVTAALAVCVAALGYVAVENRRGLRENNKHWCVLLLARATARDTVDPAVSNAAGELAASFDCATRRAGVSPVISGPGPVATR